MLSLPGRRLAGIPLADDGVCVRVPPVHLCVSGTTRLATKAMQVITQRIRGSDGMHGPWWCLSTPRDPRCHIESRTSTQGRFRLRHHCQHRRRQHRNKQRQDHCYPGRDPRSRGDLIVARSWAMCVGATSYYSTTSLLSIAT